MTQVIWKYQLDISGSMAILMSEKAKILHVDKQGNDAEIFMWVLEYPEEPKKLRHFCSIGTGYQVVDLHLGQYLGTVLLYCDRLVLHIFEELKP
jgi:hypothetical protein